MYKANFDGALDEEKQKMGMGIVIRDSNGDVIASMGAARNFVISRYMA